MGPAGLLSGASPYEIYRLGAYSSYAIVDIAIQVPHRIRRDTGDILDGHPSPAIIRSLGRVVKGIGLGVYGYLIVC